MMRLGAIVTIILVSACSPRTEAPAQQTASQSASDEVRCGTLDAIGYRCDGGKTFSVRYDPDTMCAVLWSSEHSYVLPRRGDVNTNGDVTFRAEGNTATLTGAAGGPHTNCGLEL
jgi:hypothetical protein